MIAQLLRLAIEQPKVDESESFRRSLGDAGERGRRLGKRAHCRGAGDEGPARKTRGEPLIQSRESWMMAEAKTRARWDGWRGFAEGNAFKNQETPKLFAFEPASCGKDRP